MNPYRILRVRKDASADQITKAFRQRAMETHPDRNPGDQRAAVRFENVHVAYRVLSDPARRAKYDATGIVDPQVPDNSQAKILEVVAGFFIGVMKKVFQAGADPSQVDLLGAMLDSVDASIKNLHEERRQMRQAEQFIASAGAGSRPRMASQT